MLTVSKVLLGKLNRGNRIRGQDDPTRTNSILKARIKTRCCVSSHTLDHKVCKEGLLLAG